MTTKEEVAQLKKELIAERAKNARLEGELARGRVENGQMRKMLEERARRALCAMLQKESRVERPRVVNELTGDGNITREHSRFVKR